MDYPIPRRSPGIRQGPARATEMLPQQYVEILRKCFGAYPVFTSYMCYTSFTTRNIGNSCT